MILLWVTLLSVIVVDGVAMGSISVDDVTVVAIALDAVALLLL